MEHYLFQVKKTSTPEDAEQELSRHLEHLYTIEDPETNAILLGGYAKEHLSDLFHHVILMEKGPAQQVDWTKQWQEFAPGFQNGVSHIPLHNGKVLKLKAGAGFGDLSHPTTNLALELLSPYAESTTCIDVGCGSGILSIAALLLGAKDAIGIDIDPAALQHAHENALLNGVDIYLSQTSLPESFSNKNTLIAMNMIRSEQMEAWESLPFLHSLKAMIITSGILSSEREAYLKLTQGWGWKLLEERTTGEWMGFCFRS